MTGCVPLARFCAVCFACATIAHINAHDVAPGGCPAHNVAANTTIPAQPVEERRAALGLSDLERQEAIAQILKEKRRVIVSDLARRFGFSESSIRRDLSKLEQKGQAKKVYGGAILASSTQHELNYQDRLSRSIREKNAIAGYAVKLVRPNQAILLDSGTTAMQIALRLPESLNLTVVTNGLAIFDALSEREGLSLFMLAGRYRPASRDLVGPMLVNAVKQFAVDIAFLSVDGFDATYGLSTTDHEVAEVTRAAMSIAARRVVVSDSTKGGRRAFANICPITGVDMIISDKQLDPATCTAIRETGVEVVLV